MEDSVKELICAINDLESYDEDWARHQVKNFYRKLGNKGYVWSSDRNQWVISPKIKKELENVNAN
jgi:hypothetical protein